ncbi:hypothetical protein [Microbacterium sp. NPDC089696]|uniref:hypothetical protein n=1 Tax=Microbacterium sp. NPDC089696 TaxID=3364199 RepID=UPI0038067B40
MRTPVAFVDANVLVSKTLRLWLLMLRVYTQGGLFVLHSTDEFFSAEHVAAPERDEARIFVDDVVDEPDLSDLSGADERTSRLHAAAVSSNAVYVIADAGLFDNVDLDELPYEVHTPDSFFMLVAANHAEAVDAVIEAHLGSADASKKPHLQLEQAGCPEFATCVLAHMQRTFSGKSTHGIADGLLLGSATD